MELFIALHKGIEQIPPSFDCDPNLRRLAFEANTLWAQDFGDSVLRLTDGLETTLPEDKILTQLTLYRYLKTAGVKVPIELMNLAMADVHRGLRSALEGDPSRLARHVDNGLMNWKSSIEDMGHDDEFVRRVMAIG